MQSLQSLSAVAPSLVAGAVVLIIAIAVIVVSYIGGRRDGG